jgi:NADH-quinone oxidoreductase subunit K
MHLVYPVVLAALLFATGVYGVLARRNAILVLMSVELMLNAVNLNLVTFDAWHADPLHGGQVLALFVIVIAAAEVGLGLAIVLLVFRHRGTVAVDNLRSLSERADAAPPLPPEPGPAAVPPRVPTAAPDQAPQQQAPQQQVPR